MIPVHTCTSDLCQNNIASLAFPKLQSTSLKRQEHVLQKTHDDISFSPLAELASQTGLSLPDSSMHSVSSGFYFDFNFEDTRFQAINANGFMDVHHQKMDLNLSFVVDETILNPDSETNRQFKFSLHISVEKFRAVNANINTRKEDIYSFLLRIVKTIADYASSKDKEIVDLFLDIEDIKEIKELDDGKILKDIAALIGIIYTTNQILNRDKDDIALYIPRKKETLLQWSKVDSENIQFSIHVEELALEKESDPEIAQEQPDTDTGTPVDQASIESEPEV